MSCFNRVFVLFFISTFFILNASTQNLLINEIMTSNRNVISDEDGDTPDWIELLNTGTSAINLNEYYLSDNPDELLKWRLPEMDLQPNLPLLIFASGKDRKQLPVFWYSLIDIGDSWKYIVPTEELPSNWKSVGYNDAAWKSGASGIGYGDGDDETVIPQNTLSVFMRKTITINNIEALQSMWLHIDFDDAFVAYLNGEEIARQGIGQKGNPVAFNKNADELHEAQIIQGGAPESYSISAFKNLLVEGDNTLSIQVHNYNRSSSDFSAIPIFSVGYNTSMEINKPVSEYVKFSSQYSHSNFKLSSSGETVVLSHQNLGVVDSITVGVIPGESSFGRELNNKSNWGFFLSPTPGKPNGINAFSDAVESRVQFSINEMFINGGEKLSMSGASGNEEIRYTFNGDDPTISSTLYTSSVAISTNSIVRARIFKTGAIPGFVTSRTYITDEKPELPVIAISSDPVNLWDNETGMLVLGYNYEQEMPHYGANYWEEWEKPASIEMTNAAGDRLFGINCGIKNFGGWSRVADPKSLAVFFRNEYGDPELKNVQLFPTKSIDHFKSLVIRNGGNDADFGKMRDGMMTSLVRDLDTDIQAFQPVVMYLNGQYWGIMNLREKVNEDYLENNHNVKADSVDLLEWNASVIEGSNENYLSLISYIENNDLSDNAVYQELTKQIDISNFIDYQLSQIYFNNRDWPGNNIKYWRPQSIDGKWRWIMYDTDFGFAIWDENDYRLNSLEFATATNGDNWPNPPWSTFLFRKLLENTQFKNRFINRYADILNTTFQPELVINHIDSLAAIIRSEIPNHNQRWGTLWPQSWEQSVGNMRKFATNRVDYTREHIKQQFSTPAHHNVKITILPFAGGQVQLNSLSINVSEWNGRYFEKVPITLSANSYLGYKFNSWQVNGVTVTDEILITDINKYTDIRVIFEEAENDGNSVVFNEINYNSAEGESAGDWVEIYNWGRFDLDISNWVFRDSDESHKFIIPENTILKSQEYLVLSKEPGKFAAAHPNVENYIGEFDFGLSSVGDQVLLFDRFGELVDEVVFGSENPWPIEPNGGGTTLELRQYFHDNNIAESWKSSFVQKGTPGTENSVTTGSGGMAENNLKKLNVYPNPFKNEIHIQLKNNGFEPMHVTIFSIDGRMVCNESMNNNELIWSGENTSGKKLKPGIYICKVQSGSEIFTSKIILSNSN